jgi:hypothetical protein
MTASRADAQPPSGWSMKFTARFERGQWAMLDTLCYRLSSSWTRLASIMLNLCHGSGSLKRHNLVALQ